MKNEFDRSAADETEDLDNPDALTPKQERALQALLSSRTLKEAALAADISETTLWRYQKDKVFAGRLREARLAATGQSMTRLQPLSGDAVAVLHGVMMKEDVPAAARISAARTTLGYSFRSAEVEELKSRIDTLEEFIRRKQEGDDLDAALEKESDS